MWLGIVTETLNALPVTRSSWENGLFNLPSGLHTCAHYLRRLRLVRVETPDCISPSLWQPNDPDVNLGYYRRQGVSCKKGPQDDVYHRIVKHWDKLDQRIIAESEQAVDMSKEVNLNRNFNFNKMLSNNSSNIS